VKSERNYLGTGEDLSFLTKNVEFLHFKMFLVDFSPFCCNN